MSEAQKILIFDQPMNFTYPLGNDSFPVTNGKALIPKKAWFETFATNVEAMYGPFFKIEDYDPENPEHALPVKDTQRHGFGSERNSIMMQGPVTVSGMNRPQPFGQNLAVTELDNQLAQALVSGADAVNELVAGNPEVLAGAGFNANTVDTSQVATQTAAKPKLGK